MRLLYMHGPVGEDVEMEEGRNVSKIKILLHLS